MCTCMCMCMLYVYVYLEGEAGKVCGVVADRVVEGDADAEEAVVDEGEGRHAHRSETDEQQHLE